MTLKPNLAWLLLVFLGTILGCQKEDERLAQMAERQTAQQAEQNRTFAKLQEEVAAATHDLVHVGRGYLTTFGKRLLGPES